MNCLKFLKKLLTCGWGKTQGEPDDLTDFVLYHNNDDLFDIGELSSDEYESSGEEDLGYPKSIW